METLYEKLDNLKKVLDEQEPVVKIKQLTKEILNDEKLKALIEKYNYTQDERIKEEILQNDIFREYKHYEAELNFLILELNQELKQITKKDKCGL